MICAPSNSAIDQIIMRILEEGLYDSEGTRKFPKLLKIGVVEE